MTDALSRHHCGAQSCLSLCQLPIVGPRNPETHRGQQSGRRGRADGTRLLERLDGGVDSSPIQHEPAEKKGGSGRFVALASSGEDARGA